MKNFIPTVNKRLIVQYVLIAILLYFVFHVIYGNRGVLAYFTLQQKLTTTSQELDKTRNERIELEKKVNALKPESLDRDVLDEEARRSLGVANPKEQIFIPAQE
jgi:cell division protein FtsB